MAHASGKDATEQSEAPLNDVLSVDYEITTTLGNELGIFVQYNRLGLFSLSEKIFKEVLAENDHLFAVTAEYADFLLQRGSYRALANFLDGKLIQGPDTFFKQEFEHFDHGKARQLLSLLKALADAHDKGLVQAALTTARSWRADAADKINLSELSPIDVC